MTALPGEVTQLAATIAGLFRASRQGRSRQVHRCSSGLILTVGTRNGDVIGLTRKGGQPSMDEAKTVARDAGWAWYDANWEEHGGERFLMIRPSGSPPELPASGPGVPGQHPAPDQIGKSVPPPDLDPSDEVLRELLRSPGPWRERSLTLAGQDGCPSRERCIQNFKRCQLRDFYAWIGMNWPAERHAWLAAHELEARRAQLRSIIK